MRLINNHCPLSTSCTYYVVMIVTSCQPRYHRMATTVVNSHSQQACPCGGQPNPNAVRRQKTATDVDLLSLKHEFVYPGCGNGYLKQLENEAKDGFEIRSSFLSDQLGNVVAEQQMPKKLSQRDDYVLLDSNIPVSHTFRNGGIIVTGKHLMSPAAWRTVCDKEARLANFGEQFVEAAETPYVEPTVKWAGVVLTFAAYFTENDPLRDIKSSPRRLAHMCTLQYFMEDDTAQLNQQWGPSKQGRQRLIGRRKMMIAMPPDPVKSAVSNNNVERVLNWRDLQMGVELQLYAFHVKLIDAEDFSRKLLHSLGVDVLPSIEVPDHLYDRPKDWSHLPNPTKYLNVDGSWRTGDSEKEKFQKYMCNTNQLLAFTVIYNDLHALYGDLHLFQLRFYLEDDTIEVVVHSENAQKLQGYEPWQIYLHRAKCFSQTDCNPRTAMPRLIGPADFQIGQYVRIHDRTFLVCDCDAATARWYAENLKLPNYATVVIDWRRMLHEYDTSGLQPRMYTCSGNARANEKPTSLNRKCNNGGGDSPGEPTAVARDGFGREYQLLNSTGAQPSLFLKPDYTLRFVAELVVLDAAPYNVGRKFIIRFWTVDGTMTIYETHQHNTGHIGGLLLARSRVYKGALGDCQPRIELMYKIGDSPYGREEDDRKIRPGGADVDTLNFKKAAVAVTDGDVNSDREKTSQRHFIGLADLFVGATLNIRGTVYRIIDCDEDVLRYSYQHPSIWTGNQIEQMQLAVRRHGYGRNEYGFSDEQFEQETDNIEHWSNMLEQGLQRIAAEKKQQLFAIFVQRFGTDALEKELIADHVMHIARTHQLPSSQPCVMELLRRFHDWADRFTVAGGCVSAYANECARDEKVAKAESCCPKVKRRAHDIVVFVRYLLHDGIGTHYRRLMEQADCIEQEGRTPAMKYS